jgi:hypothetical protein
LEFGAEIKSFLLLFHGFAVATIAQYPYVVLGGIEITTWSIFALHPMAAFVATFICYVDQGTHLD